MTEQGVPHKEQQAIDDILRYWFADIGAGFEVTAQHKLWYSGGPAVDKAIERQFGGWVAQALEGELAAWQATAQGTLALVILLDQFTRNIYRGSAQAFAGDPLAQTLVKQGLRAGLDSQLTAVQRSFFYMPLEHSESIADQQTCVALFEQLLGEVPAAGKATIQSSLDFALKHRDIIAQFGRFPHRNEALGRGTTAQEQAYLSGGGARFGQ
ncbi:DUF924 family protein [Oceanicoccus sagamiensis]|uniref:DUF924 domain-containing protein n=1 Tax=Oceanicoccus sagamiensis TaxID=716816 RepID=A0A1X9N8Z6_9GAMM|nr:DUF924 family protein [Oceanicoccus sagamiensis]ARN73651.1 hypothetical protein BST96_05670 [Oceanicoccus sagamiensis]